MDTEVLCPQISEKHVVITAETKTALSLSNYTRSPGTVVNVKCLSSTTHTLIGPDTITCQETGQWNKPIPVCVYGVEEPDTSGIVFHEQISDTGIPLEADIYTVLPYIVSLAILGIACVSLLALLGYVIRKLGKQVSQEPKRSTDLDSRSYTSQTGTGQTEYWVEMATSRDSLQPDLSQSRDSLVNCSHYTKAHIG